MLREFLLDMTSESELLCNGRQVGVDSDEIKGRAGGGDSGGGGVIKAGKQRKIYDLITHW